MNIERIAVAISEAFLVTFKLVGRSWRIHDITNQGKICQPDKKKKDKTEKKTEQYLG